jgi:hypothetical protein
MGCDIHSYAEVRNKETGKWEKAIAFTTIDDFDKDWYKADVGDNPFNWRSYGMFGFLADVRNYSSVPTIVEPRGIPEDVSDEINSEYEYWGYYSHTASHIYLREFVEYDYDKKFEDTRDGDAVITVREFLSEMFFQHIEDLKKLGGLDDVRVVFWFDN